MHNIRLIRNRRKKNRAGTALAGIPILIYMFCGSLYAQKGEFISPNGSVKMTLAVDSSEVNNSWYLQVFFNNDGKFTEIVPRLSLGLKTSFGDFTNGLHLTEVSDPEVILDEYEMIHGKQKLCSNSATEIVAGFGNQEGSRMDLILRVYNDGIAFRYEFPEEGKSGTVEEELTAYQIPDDYPGWLQNFTLANEELYRPSTAWDTGNYWSYPALFANSDTSCWILIHESDVDRTYCGTKLSNIDKQSEFRVTLPAPGDGEGNALPTISLPWKSPWRVLILGSLSQIAESTLVTDVAAPANYTNTEWIKPGKVSWNYWSDNHGTKDYKTVCEFADLAAAMDWPYTLLDWEWDAMGNGGDVYDALAYIHSLGVRPLLWYNSGAFKWIRATPFDHLLTHEARVAEFAKLKEMGVAGIKVDFFLSEKQDMISYYLDILEDAAPYEIMIYFHGCLVPRGWTRTYPHLMTYEGVRGAEWYNNGPQFTPAAPEFNTILPFTRNAVGPMDYTPVTFTNSQYPHLTSFGHELALSVVFESGLQHMADRPEGYYSLPDAAISFLKAVPAAWDETMLIDGFPGRDVIMARKKGPQWFVGGINGENIEKTYEITFDFLEEGNSYKLILITDGEHDRQLETQFLMIDSSSSVELKMLRRGGFAARIYPIEIAE